MLTAHGDSVPVAGTRVLLHRIGRGGQGPIDSVTADRKGAFRFRFTADTGSVYLTSSRYAGIEYFSPAVHLDPSRPDTALRIVVSDTSSQVPVELAARHLVVADPGENGTRGLLDLIVLQNRSDRTRVARDTLTPTWSAPLPTGTFGFEPGEGDVSPDALRRDRDRVKLFAPVAPGEKQLILQYGLPLGARTTTLRFEQSAGFVNVLVSDPAAKVTGGRLAPADTEVIQGRTYRRWMGTVPAGSTVLIDLGGPFNAPRWVLAALVGGLAVGLALTAVRALRPPAGGMPGSPAEGEADVLLERIAQLDARHGPGEAEANPDEWSRYRSERAQLKARLEALRGAGSGRA